MSKALIDVAVKTVMVETTTDNKTVLQHEQDVLNTVPLVLSKMQHVVSSWPS